MSKISRPILEQYFSRLKNNPDIDRLRRQSESSNENILSVYQQLLPVIEKSIDLDNEKSLSLYQQLFREMETCISNNDQRYDVVVVIPVADRPQHLQDCLGSLLNLCKLYAYGGIKNDQYQKVSVMIADDSGQPENIEASKAIVEQFNQQGLKTVYFGQQEQLATIGQLDDKQRQELSDITGNIDAECYFHKGASITRNLCYLKLRQLYSADEKVLFFFVDSDQEFRVSVNTGQYEHNVYAINYFYYLNEIFSSADVRILTGKVVGDPPVSPAVMMGRFLDDVISFFTQMSSFDGNADCQFHTQLNRSDDASYHDMAELFGFSGETPAYIYQCMLDGDHDHRACFADFSRKLNHFFDGEHPTRKNYFAPENALASVKPARTVYTGNYVIRSDMLDYFIPFANLKLRMAGPVLGRIVQAELGVAFVSANLPMLHKRTVENLGQSEYRAGVNRQQQNVDLHEEFERQYFGDVMLFTVADLIDSGNFLDSMSQEVIEKTVSRIEAGLFEKYMARREQIQNKLQTLKILFNSQQQWWHTDINMDESVLAVNAFMENVEYNFADVARAYQLITSAEHKQARCNAIVNAIKHYPEHRKSWQQAMQDINLSL